MIDEPVGRWTQLLAGRYAVALATLSLGIALYAFNNFVVITALPTAVLDIGGVELMSWTMTLYVVAAIVGGAAAAGLKQRHGASRILIVSALVFLAGTLCCWGAPSMPVLLLGRALQGAGEGVIAALSYALIPALFPSALVPKVFGVEAIVWAVAAFAGPLLAGWLTEAVSWRAAFLINVPSAAIFIALVALIVRGEERSPGRYGFPVLRLAACGAGIMLVSIAAVASLPGQITCLLAAAAAFLAVFLLDRRRPDRIFPAGAFVLANTVGAGLWVVTLMPVAHACSVYLPMIIQRVWGEGPLVGGYSSGIMAISWSATAMIVANLRDPRLPAILIRLGPVLLVAGLASVVLAVSADSLSLALLAQIVVGAAFGVSWAFVSQAVMESAGEIDRDRASAMVPTLQSAGYAVGAALAGLVANSSGVTQATPAQDWAEAAIRIYGVATALGILPFVASLHVRWRPLQATRASAARA